jgi:hypothetical protein
MARTAFSVRFPAPLADALDDWAGARQSSRSDLVEALITATTAEDRAEILQAAVRGAPTEKLNLRLSPAALAHLAQLAGDLPPADFLRRTVSAALGFAGQTPAEPRGPSSAASSPRAGRRSRARAVERADSEAAVHAPLIGVVVLVLIAALGVVIWLLAQALVRASERPPPSPRPDSRGQLDTGAPDGGGA